MIDSMEAAERNLTPKNCFVSNERKRVRKENLQSMNRTEAAAADKAAREKWDTLTGEERIPWELQSRNKIQQQPFIHNSIVDVLRSNPTLSWDQVSIAIGDWCSAATIQRWMAAQTGSGSFCTLVSESGEGALLFFIVVSGSFFCDCEFFLF